MSLKTKSFEFGEFVFDGDEKVLRHRQKPVPLTPKAILLLQTLIENSGRLVEKEKLIETVWPDSVVEEGNLSFTMAMLRKALGDNRKQPRFIETVSKRGYRFIGELKHLEPAEAEPLPEAVSQAPINRRLIVTAVPLVILVVILGVGYAWLSRTPKPADVGVKLLARTNDGHITNAAVSPDGKYLVYAEKEGSGEALWRKEIESGDQVQLIPPQPVEYVGLSVSPKGDLVYFSAFASNDAVQKLTRVSLNGGPTEPLSDLDAGVSVSFSPDGGRIAYTESLSSVNETYLKTANADGSDQRTLLTMKGPGRDLPIFRSTPAAWSPDGKTIAVAARESDEAGLHCKILLVGPEGTVRSDLNGSRWNDVEHVAWLNNGELVLVDTEPESAAKNIWRVAAETGERAKISDERSEFEWLSVAGGRIYSVQKKTHSSLYVAEYSAEQRSLRSKQVYTEASAIEMVAWTRGGQVLFNSNESGKNEIWRIEPDGTSPRQLTIGSGLRGSFAVSPADDSLVLSANRNGQVVLVSANTSGQNLRQITNGPSDANPSISADGRTAVFQRGSLKPMLWIVGLDGGQPPTQITGYGATNPEHSPDGRMISFHFMDYADKAAKWKLGVIDAAERRLINKVEFPVPITNRETAWSPHAGMITMTFEAGHEFGVLLIDPLTGRHFTIPNAGTGDVTSFAWSPDGRTLVFAQKHVTTDVVELTGIR